MKRSTDQPHHRSHHQSHHQSHHRSHHQPDEYLEALYHLQERHQLDLATLRDHLPELDPRVLQTLVDQRQIALDGERIELTEDGFRRAEQIIRRHRLAERLLVDVLHMTPTEVEHAACEFEHMVAEEITESICILLGHPRTCPHGSPIPEGACCRAASRACESAVVPLTEIPLGSSARIAYVNSTSDERHHRLTHFGIIPGSTIKLHQRRPSVVVMLDNSRLAMEECIARDIFVWKKCYDDAREGNGAAARGGGRPPRLWRR